MSSDVDGPCNFSTVRREWDPSTNPDVAGIAVCATNVVINSCLRILITFSPEDVDEGVCTLLLQVYSILLSTFASVNRDQLSTDDAKFVLVLTSPSLMIYVAAASLGDLCGVKTGLYKRIKYHRPIIRVLGALVAFIWLGLGATIAFSGQAFTDSSAGNGASFVQLLADTIFLSGLVPLAPIFYVLGIPCLMAVVFKRWSEIAVQCTIYLRKKPNPWRWLFAPWAFVKYLWFVIDHRHKSLIYILFAYLDISWGFIIILFSLPSGGYAFGYGQALAIFSSVPMIIRVLKFLKASYQKDNFSLRNTLRSFVAGTGFFPKYEEPENFYVRDGRLTFAYQMSLLPRVYPTMQRARINRNGGWPYTGSETLQQVHPGPVPEQHQNAEDSTAGILPSASPEHVQPPTSFDADIPLAAIQDVFLALSSYATTVETIESICEAHKLSPLAAGHVVERLREKLSLVHRRLRDVDSNERSPPATLPNAVSTSVNVARRTGTYG